MLGCASAITVEQAAFRAGLEALLAEWPEDCELIFVDEATVRRHPTLTSQWCLVEDVPEVPTGDDHTKVHVDGAVAPLTGRTHYHVSPELEQEEFAPFLRHLFVAACIPNRRGLHSRALTDPHSLPRSPPRGTEFVASETALKPAGLHSMAAGPQSLPLTARPLTGQPYDCMLPIVLMEYTLIGQDD